MGSLADVFCCCCGKKKDGGVVKYTAVQPDKESFGPSPRDQTSHLATHEDTTLTTDPVVIHTQPMSHSYQAVGESSADRTSQLTSRDDTSPTTDPVIHPQPSAHSHQAVEQPDDDPLNSPPDQTSHLPSLEDTTLTTDPVVIHPQPMTHSHPAAAQQDEEPFGPSPPDQTCLLASYDDTTVTTDPVDRSPPAQTSHLVSHEDTLTTDPVIHPQPMAHSHQAAVQTDKESLCPSPPDQTSHLASHEDTTLTTDPVIHPQPMAHSHPAVGGVIDLRIFRSLERSVACVQWKKLGRELGMAEYEFDAIASNNPKNISEQLYQMLLKWKESQASRATTGHLISALRRCDLNKVADDLHDLCKADPNLVSEDSHPYREHIEIRTEQIRTELREWYVDSLSRLHPIPWFQWVESDFTHMFTNLEIVPGQKHQKPMLSSWLPRLGSPAPPQGPPQAIDTEEGLVRSLWGKSGRTVSFIEGTAGIGKSCLCRRLALSWAKDNLSVLRGKFSMVFILEARGLMGNLEKCVRQVFAKEFPLSSGDICTCIAECQEKCLFIIDGVDEITGEGEQVVQELLEGRQFRRTNVLLTGRPESAGKYIKYVSIHLRITGFTWENTQLYIRKFFHANLRLVRNNLIRRIKRDKNLKKLSQTPFTTLLMCLLAEDSGGDIPASFNDIMNDIVHLTARRYISRRKKTSTEDTTVEAILRAAAQVAFKGETTGTVVFEESDLETICTHEMSGHLLLSGLFNRDFILSRLDTKGCCYFPHKSIQDFLCARHLADLDVDSLKTTLTVTQSPGFNSNPNLCEMLLNMLRDQADKYGTAMTFYWSFRFSECVKVVVRSALTVTDSRTLDTMAAVFWQYLSVRDLGDILDVPGGVRLYNLVVRRTLPVLMCGAGGTVDQNTWVVFIQDTDWSPYSRTTPDRGYGHNQYVHLPVICGVGLRGYSIRDDVWQGVTLPWVLSSLPGRTIWLTEPLCPVRINVLCVCVIPTAVSITSLSSLIDRTRASDLIVFILKPRAVTYEDSLYLRVLEMCKRAHSNPVRVSSCTVLTEVETKVETVIGNAIFTDHKLSTPPLQIHYNRHCPY